MRVPTWPLWTLLASLPAWLPGTDPATRAATFALALAAGVASGLGFRSTVGWSASLLVAVAVPPAPVRLAYPLAVGVTGLAVVLAVVSRFAPEAVRVVAHRTGLERAARWPAHWFVRLAVWSAPPALVAVAVLLPAAAPQTGIQSALGWTALALLVPAQLLAAWRALLDGPASLAWPAGAAVALAGVVYLRLSHFAVLTAVGLTLPLLAVSFPPAAAWAFRHARPALRNGVVGAAAVLGGWSLRGLWL